MAPWKIELRNVGKDRITAIVVASAPDLVKAKQQAARECRKYLADGGSLYLEAKGDYVYALILGLDEEVGEVKITQVKACSCNSA